MVLECNLIQKMKPKFKPELIRRPRRLRRTAALRRLIAETVVGRDDLIAPLFVRDGTGQPEAVESMPGVVRHTIDTLVETCIGLTGLGISAVALFPCLSALIPFYPVSYLGPMPINFATLRPNQADCKLRQVGLEVAGE